MEQKTAVVVGAGPAGLTAAFELIKNSSIRPIIFESSDMVGGIARTVNHNGNRIDIGGHRFFSKSDRIMAWWLSILPLQRATGSIKGYAEHLRAKIGTGNSNLDLAAGPDPQTSDRVMLVRNRLSRILFHRRFFDYPLSFSYATVRNLGFINLAKIAGSYARVKLFPIKTETSLEDFFINRFGRELYRTFFKDYTEKVWGVSCREIKPDWGAQRVKGLSIAKALGNALVRSMMWKSKPQNEKIETSLIEYFLYPKYGPGHLWGEVAQQIRSKGCEILFRHTVIGLDSDGTHITAVRARNEATGEIVSVKADYVISTMPIRDLVLGLRNPVPDDVRRAASDLRYRDFLTVGLLFSRLKTADGKLPDNWIYVQESDVKVGRIQVFNNWSPYMVNTPDHVWLGLEYFCQEGDDVWRMADKDLVDLGIRELTKLNLADSSEFRDGVVLRMPKAYPAYFGGYEQFDLIRGYLDTFENLFLVGRNGMHRYNNQDHSMLAAMTAVDNILGNVKSKENIWQVNAEADYHEEKKTP
jgi:protoporphyrinogen oxidase